MTEEQISHLGDEEPPEGVYTEAEAALVEYARVSTETIAINDKLYEKLTKHYDREQVMEIWAVVGVANMINRFHATFHTDVDEETMDGLEPSSCPIPIPQKPGVGR
ncbi:MAG: carboxymuconolactone decarboxylase family protein [Rubrobacteraceae bacterium]